MDRLDSRKQLRELIDGIPGGIGIFDVYENGTIELVYLNDGYYEMIGSTREERLKYYGSSVMQAVPKERVGLLQEKLKSAISGDGRFTITLPVQGMPENSGWVQLSGKIVERTREKNVFYVTYTDVTDYEQTMKELNQSRAELEMATDKVGILYWIYDDEKHETSITSGKGVGYQQTLECVPECFRGTGAIYPEDEQAYFGLYEDLKAGAESTECYARILNKKTQTYQWLHIAYTRISEHRFAGSSIDATEQKRAEQQYYTESALRRELLKDSICSYQINLTKKLVEEKNSVLPQLAGRKAPFPLTDAGWSHSQELMVDEKEKQEFDSRFGVKQLLDAWNQGVTTVRIEAYRMKLGGQIRWFKSEATMMKRPESGDIIAVTYTSEITESQNNRMAINRAFSEEMEFIGLVNMDQGTVRLVNGRENESFLPPREETPFLVYRNNTIENYVLEEDKAQFEADYTMERIREELETKPVYLLTYRCTTQDGRIRRKKLRAFYLDEFKDYLVISRRDITDLYNEELRQEAALKKALLDAESANLAKSTFLSRMSHDIRTPMNAIIGMTELASEEERLSEVREYLKKIDSAGSYLLSLINDILDMSKIESGRFEIHKQPESVRKIRNSIEAVFEPQCREKGIQFVCSVKPDKNWFVHVDSLRIRQVVMNLLSNALKYTDRGGVIEFLTEIGPVEQQFADVIMIIRDNGHGISEEFQKHMFEAFTQEANGYTATQTGTGLGLAIVKSLVELMGGTIEVHSKLGEGTCYRICIRAEFVTDEVKIQGLEADSVEKQTDDTVLAGKRVLLAEDHPLNAEIARKVLEKKQVLVDHAENGQIAVETYKASAPGAYAAILMDIRMPIMDGLTATKAIRGLARPDAKTIPIIAMTANAFDEDVKESLDSGMTDFLAKPIDVQKLYRLLEKYMQ